jgi:hypothetical protein
VKIVVFWNYPASNLLNYKAHNITQSDGTTPADQINARLAVRVKNKTVDEHVPTTPASLKTHILLLLLTV